MRASTGLQLELDLQVITGGSVENLPHMDYDEDLSLRRWSDIRGHP